MNIETENLASSSAFPAHPTCRGDECYTDAHLGLTKRALFAAMAMQGLLAGGQSANVGLDPAWPVRVADALLAELAKEPKP